MPADRLTRARPSTDPPSRGSWNRSAVAKVLVNAVPAAVLGTMGYTRRWVSDDAFIDFRVVSNLLAGHGPVFNPGERVEAYTSPLWVALLALWNGLGGRLETGAAALALSLSVAGVLAAQRGAWVLASQLDRGDAVAPRGGWRHGVVLPLGMTVFAAVPAVWDFATSGLETGLVLAWLGGVFWSLARSRSASLRTTYVSAVIVGLGPLIRPDLALFSVAFFIALSTARGPGDRLAPWSRIGFCLAALALPMSYQVFRMGYFAALVPNTALAKEAWAANWGRGRDYAWDFVGTYALWAPLSLLLPCWAILVHRARQRHDRATAALVLAPALAALAHAIYIVRVGGDFMHGRLLLPSLFALLLPLATVIPPPGRWSRSVLVVAGGVFLWAGTCALYFRVPYEGRIEPRVGNIADERGFYALSASPNPITVEDYQPSKLPRFGQYARGLDRMLLIDSKPGLELRLARSVPPRTRAVAAVRNIGIFGFVAGPTVHVVDRHGLSDPIASRLRLEERGRTGHEKLLPEVWIAARFADGRAAASFYPQSVAAIEALRCGDLAALLLAIRDPLTPRRFLENLRLSWSLRHLRIPGDPGAARARLCG